MGATIFLTNVVRAFLPDHAFNFYVLLCDVVAFIFAMFVAILPWTTLISSPKCKIQESFEHLHVATRLRQRRCCIFRHHLGQEQAQTSNKSMTLRFPSSNPSFQILRIVDPVVRAQRFHNNFAPILSEKRSVQTKGPRTCVLCKPQKILRWDAISSSHYNPNGGGQALDNSRSRRRF